MMLILHSSRTTVWASHITRAWSSFWWWCFILNFWYLKLVSTIRMHSSSRDSCNLKEPCLSLQFLSLQIIQDKEAIRVHWRPHTCELSVRLLISSASTMNSAWGDTIFPAATITCRTHLVKKHSKNTWLTDSMCFGIIGSKDYLFVHHVVVVCHMLAVYPIECAK